MALSTLYTLQIVMSSIFWRLGIKLKLLNFFIICANILLVILMINIINSNIKAKLEEILDEHTIKIIYSNRNICHKTKDGYIILFRFCDLKRNSRHEDKVFIKLTNEAVTFFTENKNVSKMISTIKSENSVDVLYEFFAILTSTDINELEIIENKINILEDDLLKGLNPDKDVLSAIVYLKHSVLRIKRYYEQLTEICETLCENLTETEHFKYVSAKMNRLLNGTMHLYERVNQLREVYQSQIDINQNNIMKVFTMFTTVFFPLTLIAGWYGMNLKMPEFNWEYGYLFVIFLSVFIAVLNIYIFKKNKWL